MSWTLPYFVTAFPVFSLRLKLGIINDTVRTSENDSLMLSFFPKIKVLLLLEENSSKIEINIFLLSAISHEIYT